MEHPDLKNLKYGILYIYSDPERMTLLHRSADFLHKIVYPMDIEWVDDPGRDGALFIARRFNVGNIGQYATVSLRTSEYNRGGGQMRALHKFTETLMGLSDPESGDIVIDEDDYGSLRNSDVFYSQMWGDELPLPSAAPQDKTRVRKPRFPRIGKLKNRLKNIVEEASCDECKSSADESVIVLDKNISYGDLNESVADPLQVEENHEVEKLEQDRKAALERIRHDIVSYIARYHDDPKELVAELLRGKIIVGQPGRLLVNGDMKIVLPEYDEMEIKMPAMCRTVYILFLKLRKQGADGIVLKNIDEYRGEIQDIYGMVKPGANERRVALSVDNLCDPLSDSLNQTISRINRCIRNVITDKELARDYCITGERGQEYGILLDPQYLELPRAVSGA